MATAIPARYLPEPPPEKMAAARVLYEGKPYTTEASVAEEVGVLGYWVRRWRREQRWLKVTVRTVPGLSAMAVIAADNMKTKMSEIGKPLDAEVAAAESAKEASTEFAVDLRANVIDRHRKEWSAPRKIAYEAIQRGDFERAKLAKISAETLTLIQSGECRAYGITHDARGADGQTVVVLDRTPKAESEDLPVSPSPGTETTGEEF
jgi:hypothetical protein